MCSVAILCSDLFLRVAANTSNERIRQMADRLLNIDFHAFVRDSQITSVVVQRDDSANKELGCDYIPSAWNINRTRLTNKIEELFSDSWINRVKSGFIETLNTALENE